MPLCTILTKCPAPSRPTQSQQGSPCGVLAEMACKMGLTNGQASSLPPGIIDGPLRAPSSPPDTPAPIKRMPLAASSCVRRVESGKFALPPSMMMSPSSRCGNNWAIKSSTTVPARTINMIFRGFSSFSTKSGMLYAPMIFVFFAALLRKSSTLETVRL